MEKRTRSTLESSPVDEEDHIPRRRKVATDDFFATEIRNILERLRQGPGSVIEKPQPANRLRLGGRKPTEVEEGDEHSQLPSQTTRKRFDPIEATDIRRADRRKRNSEMREGMPIRPGLNMDELLGLSHTTESPKPASIRSRVEWGYPESRLLTLKPLDSASASQETT